MSKCDPGQNSVAPLQHSQQAPISTPESRGQSKRRPAATSRKVPASMTAAGHKRLNRVPGGIPLVGDGVASEADIHRVGAVGPRVAHRLRLRLGCLPPRPILFQTNVTSGGVRAA